MTIVARVVQAQTDTNTTDDFLDDEAGAESSQPREFCDITYGVTTHRVAFGNRDLNVSGTLYTAIAAARGEIGVSTAGKAREMTLTLPIDHPLVARYLAYGSPPKKIIVTLKRRQETSGLIETLFTGEITSMSCDNGCTEATFRVPERRGEAALRVIPDITAGRSCPHILFDSMCQVARVLGTTYISTTATAVEGRDVYLTVPNSAQLHEWAVNGELVHVASGERMTVIDQLDIDIVTLKIQVVLQTPIAELKIGDTIELYAGCDYTIDGSHGCEPKFSNRQNFGGFREMPSKNPFIPEGTGEEGL